MSGFLDNKLLTGGVVALLGAFGGTTAFSLRDVSAEELKNMDSDELAEHLANGIDEIVEMITPMLHEAAESIGDLIHSIL